MNNVRFSIVIPVYNVENYIDICLKSLVAQTYGNMEIIIVNDGSVDSSFKICKKYSDKYPSLFKLIQQENKKQGAARNNGVRHASGDYLMFVDADDYLDKNALAKVASVLETNHYEIVGFNLFTIDENGKNKSQQNLIGKFQGEVFPQVEKELVTIPTIPVCKVYELSWYRKIQAEFPEGIIYEDVAVVPYLLASAKKVYFLRDCLYFYVQHSNSTMHRKVDERTLDILRSIDILIEKFNEKSLFEEYYAEIENVAIRTILFQIFEMINEDDFNSKYQDTVIRYLESKFPRYENNIYLSKREREKIFTIYKKDYKLYYTKYIKRKKIKKCLMRVMPQFIFVIKNKLQER